MTAVDAAPDLATIRRQVAELAKDNADTATQLESIARAVDDIRHTLANRRQVEVAILNIVDRLEKLP